MQTSIRYPFAVAALPRHLQEIIMYNRHHPTRDFFNLLSDPRPTASELMLSPMEYYLFSYVHFAVSIWRQSDRDRAYLSDMRNRSSRQLISEMSGTTIQSRGSSLDSVTIPQLRDQNIYIDLLVSYVVFSKKCWREFQSRETHSQFSIKSIEYSPTPNTRTQILDMSNTP